MSGSTCIMCGLAGGRGRVSKDVVEESIALSVEGAVEGAIEAQPVDRCRALPGVTRLRKERHCGDTRVK